MSNGNLIICDPEEGYAQALAYYLMHKKEFGMEVQVYDRIEKVQEIADRTKIQILFVAAEYEAEERKKVPAEQKFLLTGAGNSQVLEDETALYKYQSGEKIVKLLLENVDAQESENILLGQAAGKQAVRLIGVYSPVHRIGKTSYALKLGEVLNTDYIIKDIISDEKGKLPYTFKLPDNLKFQVNLYYNKKTYCEEYSVNDIENPLKIQFLTPIKEKIQVSESHQPDDVATMVSLPEWIADKDMGIDGKRYGGGIKVSISDWFISTGSSGGKDVISRITVPLDGNDGETIFEGAFVLDQSMYGTKSTGTISILVNNEEVFSTGKIGGNTLSAFPFKVNFGDADALIILTEVHLEGSDFVFGLVAEN